MTPATLAAITPDADLVLWCWSCHHHVTVPIADAIARLWRRSRRAVDQSTLRPVRLDRRGRAARLETEGAAGDAALRWRPLLRNSVSPRSPPASSAPCGAPPPAPRRLFAPVRGAVRRPVARLLDQ